jgi:hypothetical protein
VLQLNVSWLRVSVALRPSSDQLVQIKCTLRSLNLYKLKVELNPICHLLALLGGATIVVVSRLRVNIVYDVKILMRICSYVLVASQIFFCTLASGHVTFKTV